MFILLIKSTGEKSHKNFLVLFKAFVLAKLFFFFDENCGESCARLNTKNFMIGKLASKVAN